MYLLASRWALDVSDAELPLRLQIPRPSSCQDDWK